MTTVSDILNDLGGPSKVAESLGLPLTTVHSWGRANHVPAWRRREVIALAKKKRKPLAEGDFPARQKVGAA